MVLNREIGMEIGAFLSDRLSVTLQILIIYVTCSSTIAAPVALYPKAKKRQYYDYFLKNRQYSGNDYGNRNDAREYDRPLVYRDLFLDGYRNDNSKTWDFPKVKSRDVGVRKNRMPGSTGIRRSFERADGMTRILTFPLKDNEKGMINGFEPGDPASDCLTGGLDAGVVNGALKIGIGVGLAPGCGTSTEQPPKMVPVPVFIPRPIPVPQPYPVAIDVPRPIPIRVPQPVPFPSLGMGALSMMGGMPPFPGRIMIGSRGCLFQNCEKPSVNTKAETQRRMVQNDQKHEIATERSEYAENTIMAAEPKSMKYRSLKSTNRTK